MENHHFLVNLHISSVEMGNFHQFSIAMSAIYVKLLEGQFFVDTPAKMSRATFGHTGRNQHLMPGNFIFVHETRRRGEGFSIAVRQSLFC